MLLKKLVLSPIVLARIKPGPSAWKAGFIPTTPQDRDNSNVL